MKIQNIALPDPLKIKLTRIKLHLWRGNIEPALYRLDERIARCSDKSAEQLETLKTYIINNANKIINYQELPVN